MLTRGERQATKRDGIVVAYIRVTREESFKGDSPKNQEARFHEIATAEGWLKTRVFREPRQVSGETSEKDRPALRKLMDAARRGSIRAVVVRHLDRLGRGHVLLPILEELCDLDVQIRTFAGPVDFATAHGEAMVGMQAVFSRLETRITGERIRESRRRRLVDGYWPARAPFGYTSQARHRRLLFDLHGDGDQAREEAVSTYPRSMVLYLDPEEVQVVEAIFDLVEQGWGCTKIARFLNDRGDTYRGGSRWREQYVRKVLRDPKVAGWTHFDNEAYLRHRKSKLPLHRQARYEGKHEAIIDRARWLAVQEIIDVRGRARRECSEKARTYPLTGVSYDQAGHRLVGSSSQAGGPWYYACGHHRRGQLQCDSPPVRADELEAAVQGVLAELLVTPEQVVKLVDKVNRELAAGIGTRRSRVDELLTQVTKLEADRERALRRAADAEDDDLADVYADAARRLKEDIREAKMKLDDAKEEVVPTLVPTVDEVEVARHLGELLGGLGDDLEAYSALVDQLREHHGLRVTILERHLARVAMNLDLSLFQRSRHQRLRVVHDGDTRLPFEVEVMVGDYQPPVSDWVEEQQGEHICGCGCGKAIEILPRHHAPAVGIPAFIKGHFLAGHFVEGLNARGLLTVSQAATELGVSTNTLRRAEAKGWVSPLRGEWGQRRVYREEDIPKLRAALVEAGFRFKGDVTYTTADVAKTLGVSETTIRKWERDGRIPKAARDTCNNRLYGPEDVDAIKTALGELRLRDREILEAAGLVTRSEAQTILGIGNRRMQKLISAGDLEPVWRVLASSKRKKQCFWQREIEMQAERQES